MFPLVALLGAEPPQAETSNPRTPNPVASTTAVEDLRRVNLYCGAHLLAALSLGLVIFIRVPF